MKYIKVAIVTIIVLIIIVIASLIFLKQRTEKQADYEAAKYGDVEKVTSEVTFYTIDSSINKYLNYVIERNVEATESITDSGANDIINMFAKYAVRTNFDVKKIYSIDKTYYMTGFVYGKMLEDEYYLIINLDYNNKTFSIVHSNKQEFENATNNIVDDIYRKDSIIRKNAYNEIVSTNLTDLAILEMYFEDYKYKAINNPEIAFNMLDTEYKVKKFNNDINLYKEYIQKNISRFQDANIVKHKITKDGQYREYVCIDNYNNYYKFIETDIKEYTVILDNYTIENEELINQYNKLSDQEKVSSNIDKVMKLINSKSYTELYGYLNEDFKNMYFKTQQDFEKYITSKFFDNNIVGGRSIENEGNIYIIKVPYKESLSTAAEEGEITFNMKLKEGTDFELSFNMD